MKVKKYKGKTVQDAIFQVKADMGSDAIILDTRHLKQGGFLGLFKSKYVEVVAGLEEERNKLTDKNTIAEINELKEMIRDLKQDRINEFCHEDLPAALSHLFNYLQAQGINDSICKDIVSAVKNSPEYPEKIDMKIFIRNYLQDFIGEAAPISIGAVPHVTAFVGPTGVGKTTTIAKIAAEFAVNKNKKVGLITTDTYRVAAVQQIEIYSELVELPLKVIYSADNLRKVIDNDFKDYDLILIDTAGASWNNHLQLGRIKSFIDKNLIDEVQLLISVNMKTEDLMSIIKHFSRLELDKILLTKLDAASNFGDIVNLRDKYDLPYSYFTNGQDVPEDISAAEPKKLVDYIMEDYNE